MNRLIIFAAVIAAIHSGCQAPQTDSLAFDTITWEERAGKYAGKMVEIESNTALVSLAGKTPFNTQVALSAILKAPLENGLPNEVEREQLAAFEKEIVRALVTTRIALFASKVATDSRYDFILYARDPARAEQVAKDLAAADTSLTIEVIVKKDKTWTTYKWFNTWQ